MRHYRSVSSGTRLSRENGRAALAGVLAAGGGLAVSELLSGFAHLRVSPLGALAECIIRLTPGRVDEYVIQHFGHNDKPLVIIGSLVALGVIAAVTGIVATRSRLVAELVFAAIGVVVVAAVHSRLPSGISTYLPAVLGSLVAMLLLNVLVDRAQAASAQSPGTPAEVQRSRRSFLLLAGSVAVVSAGVVVAGRVLAHARAQVDAARAKLAHRFASPPSPDTVSVGVDGVAPWMTPVGDFYRVDTAFSVPLLVPDSWQLRIHGMVEHELTLTYADLLDRGLTQHWMTLCCVSNPVGGPYISNGYWEGALIGPILDEVKPLAGADAVLSRSSDGWTAGTPLAALRNGRTAMFALALNGQPLTPEHGFPVRMIVPGLYGYVSGTKWIVDFEVTRFSDFSAFWTQRGWSEQGPVKTQSKIEVPRSGATVSAGRVAVAGVAWAQHTGIKQVEVRIDTEPWRTCRLAADPTIDSWRQWAYEWDATRGLHTIQVRATDDSGATQTSTVQGVLPNGATGYDQIQVSVH